MATGIMAPPPRPCRKRHAISISIELAMPASMDPPRNRPMPKRKIGLRPILSLILPAMGMVMVSASIYAVKSQAKRFMPPSSPPILGRLVPTTVWSRLASSIPKARPIMMKVLVLFFSGAAFSGSHGSGGLVVAFFLPNIVTPFQSVVVAWTFAPAGAGS